MAVLALGLLLGTSAGLHVSARPAVAMSPSGAAIARPGLGVNLAGVTDWTTETPFVDVFRTSRSWVSQATTCPGLRAWNCRPDYAWGVGPALSVDRHGWLTSLKANQYVDAPIFTSGRWPAGRYVVTWEGKGDVAIRDAGTEYNRTANRFEYELVPRRPGYLAITGTDPADYVRNIHVWMPGYEQTGTQQVFHPNYLKTLAGMKTLRFMDFMRTNGGSPFVHWDDYPNLDSSTQTRGVAPELIAELSNRVGADAWVNMPHQADDDFIRHFAQAIHDNLDPGRKVYIEYSNEVWNTAYPYPQTGYARKRGLELGLSDTDWIAGFRYQARRSVEIFRIWADVFGAEADTRMVRVLGLQSANHFTAGHVLDWSDAATEGRPAAGWADAIAIAPYIHCNDQWLPKNSQRLFPGTDDAAIRKAVLAAGVDRLLDGCQRSIDLEIRSEISTYKALADRYGLALVAYEGGQHLVNVASHNENRPDIASVLALDARFQAANRNPRMRDLYARYLQQWRELGGGTMMLFLSTEGMSQYGSWGLREYQGQPLSEAPKAQAAAEFSQALKQAPLQAAQPTVSALSARGGLAAGGTALTITGANLASTSTVLFGGVSAPFRTVVVKGATQVMVTTPRYAAAGTVDVTVTNPAGTSGVTTASRFVYYPPPVVAGLSPSTAVIVGDTTISVTGTGLSGATKVLLGTVPAKSIKVLSPTSLTFVAPARATTGTVDVTVTTAYGISPVLPVGRLSYVTPSRPVVTGLSADAGPAQVPTVVLINGSGFRGTTQVTIGSRRASSFTVLADNQIRAVFPPQPHDTWVNVHISTSGGTSEASSSTDFHYTAAAMPAVSRMSITTGQTYEAYPVVIDGQGFTWATKVSVGGISAPFTIVSNNQLRVTVPARTKPGAVNVQITTPAGASTATASSTFTYTAPPRLGGTSATSERTMFTWVSAR